MSVRCDRNTFAYNFESDIHHRSSFDEKCANNSLECMSEKSTQSFNVRNTFSFLHLSLFQHREYSCWLVFFFVAKFYIFFRECMCVASNKQQDVSMGFKQNVSLSVRRFSFSQSRWVKEKKAPGDMRWLCGVKFVKNYLDVEQMTSWHWREDGQKFEGKDERSWIIVKFGEFSNIFPTHKQSFLIHFKRKSRKKIIRVNFMCTF